MVFLSIYLISVFSYIEIVESIFGWLKTSLPAMMAVLDVELQVLKKGGRDE